MKQVTYSLHAILLSLILCPARKPPSVPVETRLGRYKQVPGSQEQASLLGPQLGKPFFKTDKCEVRNVQ